ncbi:hypothetical protein M3J09_001751 [Ascochyta lentis]
MPPTLRAGSASRCHSRGRNRQNATKRNVDDLSPEPGESTKFSRLSASQKTKTNSSRSTDNKMPDFSVAIDLGTTFTTVAHHLAIWEEGVVETIDTFPGAQKLDRTGIQQPTEIWYPDNKSAPVRFGHEVTHLLGMSKSRQSRASYSNDGRVVKPKLLLDSRDYVDDARSDLLRVLNHLQVTGQVVEHKDVLTDFLTYLFAHTREYLELHYSLKEDSSVEVTFCVPVCWPADAVSTLSQCVQKAMQKAKFGTDGTSPCHMFIVNEAEAQAMTALMDKLLGLKAGDTFMIIDCGGGTTDVGIYRIASTEPLRLESEVNEATGAMIGSGDVNEAFRRFAYNDLKNEDYLVDDKRGTTLNSIIEMDLMHQFENTHKPAFGNASADVFYSFRLPQLRQSDTNPRITDGFYELTSADMEQLFKPSARGIRSLMIQQIAAARSKEYDVDKLVVVGGFADSPYLIKYLKESLEYANAQMNTNTELISPPRRTSATGVATGAIHRAMNKEHGPKRIPRQSIGILRHIPYEPKARSYRQQVLRQKKTFNNTVGQMYIVDTIEWLIKRGMDEMQAVHVIPFTEQHGFLQDNVDWVIRHEIYASSTCMEDFYKFDHPKNYGKVLTIGEFEFDLKDLQNRIRAENISEGRDLNDVTISVEMKVIDRYLEFNAHWVSKDGNSVVIPGAQNYFSVASAFKPGTE